MVGKKSIIF